MKINRQKAIVRNYILYQKSDLNKYQLINNQSTQ